MNGSVVTIQDTPDNMPMKVRKNEVIMHQNAIEPGRPQYLRVVDLGRKRQEVKQKGKFPDAEPGTYELAKRKGAKGG